VAPFLMEQVELHVAEVVPGIPEIMLGRIITQFFCRKRQSSLIGFQHLPVKRGKFVQVRFRQKRFLY
jgi:hypothetical protein